MAYFDNNSTTRPFDEVRELTAELFRSCWGNPSSPHQEGRKARALIERAREEIAHALKVDPKNLIFTSGATESNNALLESVSGLGQMAKGRALISAVEHPSMLEAIKRSFAGRVDLIPVNSSGRVQFDQFRELFEKTRPSFVSMMAAHNESGVLQPWHKTALFCKERNVWFHCDATQWIGKLDPAGLSDCSSFCFSGHKFGGPKGVGSLFSPIAAGWFLGGGQEMERRGGTENVPGIEGMRMALKKILSSRHPIEQHRQWKEIFERKLLQNIPGTKIIGQDVPRLWNTSYMVLPEFDNLSWVTKLNKLGFSLSTGSACSTARLQTSGLAPLIGLSQESAKRLVRVSSFYSTTQEDWLSLADAFKQAHGDLAIERDRSGVISL